ncbi:AMP-binding protein [Amycolatopsis sp. Hca4]|uniref:AMP-binding protein n=1 Tax=Amycolatopsis sp. Hca4 TaxID=2742131 RepID=UPI001591F856|nr:AMP-binding protein [Amycolatopsis sp. Hca4]QKV78679.1 AMP-binding protein [Amycolatopsis sp. Hca4]
MPEDVAYLQYPGGVMVTHANVLANARQAAEVLGRATVVTGLPPSDPLGLVLGVAVPIVTDRPAVLGDDASVPEALREAYVVAEATALVACGRPAGQRVAIVDRDGRRVPAGDLGEIWVSGPNVARGYWRRPGESARVFCARLTGDDEPRWWLRTGDQGFLDPAGTCASPAGASSPGTARRTSKRRPSRRTRRSGRVRRRRSPCTAARRWSCSSWPTVSSRRAARSSGRCGTRSRRGTG